MNEVNDLEFTLKNCSYNDIDFIFELKKLCLKWYIQKIYGWDDDIQRVKTANELKRNIDNMKIIQVDGNDVGITTFEKANKEYRVGLIMIHPNYQNKGIATNIISNYINIAKQDRKRIVIKTYKENPARKLYERLGFSLYETDETHAHLEINII